MKRSRSLSLILMGSILMGSQGCSSQTTGADDEVFSTFSSLSECAASNLFTESECKELAGMALAQNPRFATQAECEAAFGANMCSNPEALQTAQAAQTNSTAPDGTVVQQRSGSLWLPMMMGFMAGRMLSGSHLIQGAQPLYKDPAAASSTRSFRTATGETVTPDAKGRVAKPSQSIKQSIGHVAKPATGRTPASSKGGLGGSSRLGSSGS